MGHEVPKPDHLEQSYRVNIIGHLDAQNWVIITLCDILKVQEASIASVTVKLHASPVIHCVNFVFLYRQT